MVFQRMTILEEAHHPPIVVEHDPMLYENTAKMAGCILRALEDTAHQATVLLYSPGIDPFLESLSETTDKVFYFDEGPDDSPEACGENLSEDGEPDHAGWAFR